MSVYDDALASGWQDWSWGTTRNFAVTSPVSSGTRSLQVTYQAWGGLYLRRSAGSVSGMATLELYANGGTSAGTPIAVQAMQGSTSLPAVALAQYCAGGTIPANAWARCRVPLSTLLPRGGALDGIWLQESGGSNRPAMYFDSIALLPAAPAQPAGVIATASASSISVSWTAVAGATGYDVLRATASAGPFTKLTASPQSATSYADGAAVAGTTYWYQVVATNGGGSGPASAAASATINPPTQPADVSVYADALASGWQDWSWGTTRNFAATSPVASGSRSLAVTYQAWGGLYFRRSSSLSGANAIALSVNGGSSAGTRLRVQVISGSTTSAAVDLAGNCAGGAIPANAWTRCSVPLSAFGLSGKAVDGFWIQEANGASGATVYLDDVALTGSSSTTPPAPALPTAPSGLAAAVFSGAVTLSWTAVPGATGYVVTRATASGGPYTQLTTCAQAGYTDATVAAGSTYWYRVAAVNAAGTGPTCAAVSAAIPAPPPAVVTVKVTPTTATIDACTTAQLSATVTGATDGSVTWSVQEGAAGGTVDASGRYTAPSTAGTYHVVATSKASTSATASVPVVVKDHILSIAVSPVTASAPTGGQQQFTATVTTTCGTFAATAR